MKIGDRVEILRRDIHAMKHRKVWRGRVVDIDGAYILVRPHWTSFEVSLYQTEIRII
jgi:hypothetical protein